MNEHRAFIEQAIELAAENAKNGQGGPFGAVIVKDGEVIATGVNAVTSTNDPTAHAEIVAIRQACKVLGVFQLQGCEIYTNCEPCPMCLAAMYWARPSAVYYASSQEEAAKAGFDDSFIYRELKEPPGKRKLTMIQILCEEASRPFQEWANRKDRVDY